jgi:hypothetical protein
MSHRGRHTSPLLLRATTTTTIQVISHGAVATKGHNNDLPISTTSLTESGTGLHKYLFISSALRRWLKWIDLPNFWCVRGRHPLFIMQLSKRETRLPISPISLAELGRSHVKEFHINICFIQHRGNSSPH